MNSGNYYIDFGHAIGLSEMWKLMVVIVVVELHQDAVILIVNVFSD